MREPFMLHDMSAKTCSAHNSGVELRLGLLLALAGSCWILSACIYCGSSSHAQVIKLGRFKFRVRQLVATSYGGMQPELRHGPRYQRIFRERVETDSAA